MVLVFCISNSLEFDWDTFDWVELVEIDKDHGIVQNQTSWMDAVVVVVVVDKQMEGRHLAWVVEVDNGTFVAVL
jgi:hypothetical protein